MKVVGTKVVRGKGWESGNEDGTNSRSITQVGTVVEAVNERGWVRVMWPNGRTISYKVGASGKYELQLAGA